MSAESYPISAHRFPLWHHPAAAGLSSILQVYNPWRLLAMRTSGAVESCQQSGCAARNRRRGPGCLILVLIASLCRIPTWVAAGPSVLMLLITNTNFNL